MTVLNKIWGTVLIQKDDGKTCKGNFSRVITEVSELVEFNVHSE